MLRTFIRLKAFETAWAMMGLDEEDYQKLENQLLLNPKAGDLIPGSGGARKLRITLHGKGKRGGARVIYVDFIMESEIYLLYAYPKSVY
jgi:hypothetical protein